MAEILETTVTVAELLVILFITLLAEFISYGVLVLMLDRRYRETLQQAEIKAERAIEEAKNATDDADAKTRARIDFLMSLIPARDGSGPGDTSGDYQVLEILMSRFDEEELKALAFELGIRWETLGGDKPVTKALNLVQAARNQNKMRSLIAIIKRDRPEAMHP